MLNCTLAELVTRRMRDYGIEGVKGLMRETGLSWGHASGILSGKQDNVGIEARRALVKALDLDPDVIERSVREGC